MRKCVFGFDFGTLSCRGVAVNLEDGALLATAESRYEHGVIFGELEETKIQLKPEWFLQDPLDWLNSMEAVSRTMRKIAGIRAEEVVAIGTDFTSCTLLPIKQDGTPLCEIEEYKNRPNAWPKLWKHHGAQKYAAQIETYARAHTSWLKAYFGNSVSSEWVFPKAMQVLEEDPDIYEAADYFIEAVDWIVYRLTGQLTRNEGICGVNAFYIKGQGYPDRNFCRALDSRMENFVETRLSGRLVSVGECAGFLTKEMAERLGLIPGTTVSSGHGDSAVAACGAGITESGSMVLVMGTSTCHQMLYRDYIPFDGVCSIAADGMIPGLYSYESGQPATGDLFEWFSKQCFPIDFAKDAKQKGMSALEVLGEKAAQLKPGQNGLIALDWWNGNRSILSNYDLTGMIIGFTLATKTEEIYRALVEANLFGSRRILENYEQNGIKIKYLYAVGGIAVKSPWIMQLCADILNREVHVPIADNIPARGAAVCAAVALGKPDGCKDFQEASERLIAKNHTVYRPSEGAAKMYERLYCYYLKLHDAFGNHASFMRELKELRESVICGLNN